MILIALSYFAGRCNSYQVLHYQPSVANVVDGFHGTGLIQYTNSLALHSLPLDISQKDIRHFSRTAFHV